jgi:hypothetical protein
MMRSSVRPPAIRGLNTQTAIEVLEAFAGAHDGDRWAVLGELLHALAIEGVIDRE